MPCVKDDFERMHPKYPDLTSEEICERIKTALADENLYGKAL